MRRGILRGTAILGLAAAMAAIGVGLPAQAAPKAAPSFSLELFNGQTLTLATLKGSDVILLFWAPW